MIWVIDVISWLSLLAGGFFLLVGSLGMVRLPDFWARLHAASVIDSAGIGLLILGMALQAGFTLVTIKLFLIVLFLLVTGPTATHAIAAVTLFLFVALIATAIAIIVTDRLFAVVMISGAFSLLSALLFVTMDAVDVAFTEAAVGAGISTVLMLGTIALTARSAKPSTKFSFVPFFVVALTGAVLMYGTLDMPIFGAAHSPVQTHVGPDYISRTPQDIDVPNIVTAVLGSYRGYDTLGEVTVVFTAGLGVILLLSGLGRRRKVYKGKSSSDE